MMTCEYCPWFEINFCKYHDKRMNPSATVCDEMIKNELVLPPDEDLAYLFEYELE